MTISPGNMNLARSVHHLLEIIVNSQRLIVNSNNKTNATLTQITMNITSILTNKSIHVESGVVLLSRDAGISELIPEISKKIEISDEIPPEDIVKNATRRLVFRIAAKDHGSLIVKSFPLAKLRHKIKHKKYAYNETINLLTASERGLKVPKVFAYGFKKSIGLVQWNVVCMENIDGISLRKLLTSMNSDREKILTLAKIYQKVLKPMYVAGCNHIDLGGDNIIFAGDENNLPYIIDFQYCTFKNAGSYKVMAAQTGHLCRDLIADECITRSMAHEWFRKIFGHDNAKQREIETVFDKYLNNRISRKERLSI